MNCPDRSCPRYWYVDPNTNCRELCPRYNQDPVETGSGIVAPLAFFATLIVIFSLLAVFLWPQDEPIKQEVVPVHQPATVEKRYETRIMTITFYTTAEDECGKADGITSDMKPAVVGRTVAAGPGVPFGTRIFIPGIGWRVVEDRGGAIDDYSLDCLVDTKEEAFELGRQQLEVLIEHK